MGARGEVAFDLIRWVRAHDSVFLSRPQGVKKKTKGFEISGWESGQLRR